MRTKGRKSFYFKFFFSFMLALLTPILATVMIYFQARSIVEKQIITNNRNILEQFFRHIDSALDFASDTCMSLLYNSPFLSLSKQFLGQPDKHAYYVWQLGKQLDSFVNEKYQDFFVYYPENDYVVSIKGADYLKNYCKFNYSDEEAFFTEFEQVANSPYKKPVLYGINGIGMDSYQCVAMRKVDAGIEYVVVVVLRQSYVNEVLQNVDENEGVTFIMDARKEVVFCTDENLVNQETQIYQETDELYTCELGEKKYMVLSRPSEVLSTFYAYAVPTEYFWSGLYNIHIIFLVGLGASVLVGMVLAYWQTNRMYRPFNQTMGRLQTKTIGEWDSRNSTELEFIERVFDLQTKEKEKLSIAAKEGKERKRNDFIRFLFGGGTNIPVITDDVFSENDIILCSSYFCVEVISVEERNDMEPELLAFVLHNVLEEMLGGRHRSYVVPLMADKYGVLVNLASREEYEDVVSLMNQARQYVKKHFRVQLTAGVSTVQEGMAGISDAYREASEALKYSFLLGKGIMIRYTDVASREFRYCQTDKLRQLVIGFLGDKNCDEKLAPGMVDECLKCYGIDSEASLDMVECFKFEAVNTFHIVLRQKGYWNADSEEEIMSLIGSESLAEFREKFAGLLAEIARRQRESAQETDISARARDYIDKNYNDSSLSLVGLADMLGITPFYLTKLFKEKYQLSVPDYLLKVRLSHAKDLLSNTTNSIQSIAVLTGFVESSSFIRVFKKTEGITPGGYRKLVNKGGL